jgi:hypothetical protein
MRQPRIRTVRKERRLGCGCMARPGDTVVTRGKTWLCAGHQPWLPLRTIEEVLAEYRDRGEDANP